MGELDKALEDYSKLIELQEVIIANMKQTAETNTAPKLIEALAPNLEPDSPPAPDLEQAELPQQDVPDLGAEVY